MKVFILIAACCLSLGCGQSQTAPKEVKFEAATMPEGMADRLHLLVKNTELLDFFEVDKNSIKIFASAEDKAKDSAECSIPVAQFEAFQKLEARLPQDSLLWLYEKGKLEKRLSQMLQDTLPMETGFQANFSDKFPLRGMRVALDPGHTSPDIEFSEIEGKYVKIRPSALTQNEQIRFHESALTLATAQLVRQKLETLGAEVLMTRTSMDMPPLGITFADWRRDRFSLDLDSALAQQQIDSARYDFIRKGKATEKQIFYWLFNAQDLDARARMINEFRPHLTLILHYNIHLQTGNKFDSQGFYKLSKENYSMAFVPGSFMTGELDQPEQRLAFLRLLLCEHQQKSVALSGYICQQFESQLKVPLVDSLGLDIGYLQRGCIRAQPAGVYARNLRLTRSIHGPLCYGESLIQNNSTEAFLLNQKDTPVEGIQAPARIKKVADAYVEGILRWTKK